MACLAFTDLGVSLVSFQGGTIILRGYGCSRCGNGFWTEDDKVRRLPAGEHPCPHCGQLSYVGDAEEQP
jgi:DNA-directed RNA polymerase subunit RPC12/RpoP